MAEMATAAGRNSVSELNCPICLENFNLPKRLPCLHTFCEPCIQSYVQVQKSVTEEETRFFLCPLCRFKTELPDISVTEWTQSKLPTDHLIASLLGHETIVFKHEEVFCEPCTFASEKNVAKYYCLDCKEFFCEQCFNYLHKRKRDNNLHTAIIVTPDSDLRLLEMEEPCPLHTNKVLEAFCFDHRKLCCSFCFMSEHRKCDIVKSLDEIAKDEKESLDMDIFVKSISEAESKTFSSLQKANERLAQLSDDKDSMLQSLTEIIENTKSHLDTLHRELKGSIEKSFANTEESQQFEVECIASFQKMLMYNKKLVEAVKKHGSRKQKFVTIEKTRSAIQKDYEKFQLISSSSETSKCYVLDIEEELKSVQKWSKLGSVKSEQQCGNPFKDIKESLCDLGCFKDFTISQSRSLTPRSSMEQETERALSAVSYHHKMKDVVGFQTTPRQGQIKKSSKSATATAKELTEKEMEKKTKSILDEYLHLQDTKEAILDIKELKSPSVMHTFVSSAVNHVLERSNIARNQTGLLLHDLVKKNIISIPVYIQGLIEVIQYGEDMEIDIPHIWRYLGELIGPVVQDGSVPLSFLRKAAEPLKENNKAGLLVAEVLHAASHREGQKKVGTLWRQSSLQWEDFMPAGDVKKFIIDKKVEFTAGDDRQPNTPTVSISMEAIQNKLNQLLIKEKADNEVIFDWIEESVGNPTMKSNKFIRVLMTLVCRGALTGSGSSTRVLPEVIKKRGDLLQKYFNHRAESELQALYALQALVHKLKHPQGVLRTLFDTLYDEDIISEDRFHQWEKSKDPNEQEGKDVAMKQVVQFFTWLREAEEDVSDSWE